MSRGSIFPWVPNQLLSVAMYIHIMGCRRTKSNRGREHTDLHRPLEIARRKRRTRRGGAPAAQHEAAKRAIRDYNIRKQLAVKAAGLPGRVLPAVSPVATDTAGIQAYARTLCSKTDRRPRRLLGPHRAPSTGRRKLAPSIRFPKCARAAAEHHKCTGDRGGKKVRLSSQRKWVKEISEEGRAPNKETCTLK